MLRSVGRISGREVRANGLYGTMYCPEGAGAYPPVMVLGGSEGWHPESAAIALAREGFAAMSLMYFGPQLRRELVGVPLEYFLNGLKWMISQPDVSGERVALVGSSKGGEAALLVGATYPGYVSSVVGYVASSVVYQGISFSPMFSMMPRPSSWTIGGRPVPFVDGWTLPGDLLRWQDVPLPVWPFYSKVFMPEYPISLLRSYTRPLDRGGKALRAATIPVENIEGPVMLVSGAKDRLWPASRLSEMAIRRLSANDHPHERRHLCYEDAGHLIPLPGYESLNPDFLDFGGSRKADIAAGRDAWTKTVDFLGRHADVGRSAVVRKR